MDAIASKAFGSGKDTNVSTDGDKRNTAAATGAAGDEPIATSKVESSASSASASTSAGSSNQRDSVFEELDPTVAAARKKKAAADAAGRDAKAEAQAKQTEKDKDGNPVAAPSFLDEVMGEIYQLWGGDWKKAKANFFAKNFYDGGFEDKMTRREAALILGVRENTGEQRIKESHRRILLLNHPDRGGSPYVAAKINLAKDLLIKGK